MMSRQTVEPIPKQSLMDRARSRLHNNPDCVYEAVQGKTWIVKPDSELGDTRQRYSVSWNEHRGKYRCVCYSVQPAGVPRPKICSHVLAVVMWRKDNVQGSSTDLNISEVAVPSIAAASDAVESVTVDAAVSVTPAESPGGEGAGLVPLLPGDISLNPDHAYPDWVKGFRPHQWTAICEVVEMFKEGKKVVWLDAPTGAGKTLIAETVRRIMAVPALYVCSGKELQDQFVGDFDYAAVLKGKSNYPTQVGSFPAITADDCTAQGPEDTCKWCPDRGNCGYTRAKVAALRSNVAVLNTTYLLTEANGPGRFSGRKFGILDECDVLEKELMGYVEFYLGSKQLQDLHITAPKKGSHYKTIVSWIKDELRPAAVQRHEELTAQGRLFGSAADDDVKFARKIKASARLIGDIDKILSNAGEGEGTGDNWVRDNDAGPLSLKPVSVADYGQDLLWRHCEQWLCMSATIISPELMAESLGLGGDEWGVVRVPMTFPVENRRIIQSPVANMVYKEKDTAWPEMVEGIASVLMKDEHKGERVLVHAVSYALAQYLCDELGRKGLGRDIYTYRSARDRSSVIAKYRATEGAVIIAPSLDRGVDFKGDDCRVVIVAKVPSPSLGDPQVSKKLHGDFGELWYAVQTVRSLVQMTGRGVRSEEDWAVSYVLDAQFGKNLYRKRRNLFPSWWSDAVEFTRVRELMG